MELPPATSAIVAAAAALLGVWLGGRADRENRREDRDAAFKRETLIDLQDTLEVYVLACYSLQLWREAPEHWNKLWSDRAPPPSTNPFEESDSDSFPPPFDLSNHYDQLLEDGHLDAQSESMFRLERLVSRVEDDQVQAKISAIIAAGRKILTSSTFEEIHRESKDLNERLGKLISRS